MAAHRIFVRHDIPVIFAPVKGPVNNGWSGPSPDPIRDGGTGLWSMARATPLPVSLCLEIRNQDSSWLFTDMTILDPSSVDTSTE